MGESKPKKSAIEGTDVNPVIEYKTIFQAVLDGRPSGTRQRLAEAIGKNRSFVSQISNPAYSTPIPVQHVERILSLCHFSTHQRAAFLEAYKRAHPRRCAYIDQETETRDLSVPVPNFGDDALNRAFDQMVSDVVKRMAHLVSAMRKG